MFYVAALSCVGLLVLLGIHSARIKRVIAPMSEMLRRLGEGTRPNLLPEIGPSEARVLIRELNQMFQRLSNYDDDRVLMFAGIAHYIKAPLTRLKLRARVIQIDGFDADQFVGDIDQIARTADLLIVHARRLSAESSMVGLNLQTEHLSHCER